MNTLFNDPVIDLLFAVVVLIATVYIIHKATNKISVPRKKLTEAWTEEDLVSKQRLEDYEMERVINHHANKMFHYYTHGEPVYQMPIKKAYKVLHEPTAKYLGKNIYDIVIEEFGTRKLKFDIEHGPVIDKFQASLKKPNLL